MKKESKTKMKTAPMKSPQYTLSDKMISLVAEITEIATHLEMRESVIDPLLHKKNRLKTIHSSLAIEHNSLSLQQVTDIIDGKRVFGPPKEIEEVKNAKAAYAVLEKVDRRRRKVRRVYACGIARCADGGEEDCGKE